MSISYTQQLGLVSLRYWLNGGGHKSPQDAESDDYWRDRFRMSGPFLAEYDAEIDAWLRPLRGEVVSYEPAPDLQPPARLYRAAAEGYENRWSWTDDFATARDIADMRGGNLEIWACDPAEVFGCVRIVRREPMGGVRKWNDWILRPKRVWKVPRWRDPMAPLPAADTWAERGVSAEEVEAIVNSWVVRNDLQKSPMDRESDQFWLDTFSRLGQFHAKWRGPELPNMKATVSVAPARGLVAPEPLYRGAEEELSRRWSWTPQKEAAEFYRKDYGPNAKIWTCAPQTVLGRIDIEVPQVPGLPRWPSFAEWIVIPSAVWEAEELPTTVAQLAEQMGSHGDEVERVLREGFPGHPANTPWEPLSEEQVNHVRLYL